MLTLSNDFSSPNTWPLHKKALVSPPLISLHLFPYKSYFPSYFYARAFIIQNPQFDSVEYLLSSQIFFAQLMLQPSRVQPITNNKTILKFQRSDRNSQKLDSISYSISIGTSREFTNFRPPGFPFFSIHFVQQLPDGYQLFVEL